MAEIGSTLREARMRARIDISEVEARTKIRAKYLRAIENEEWDLLPGPVYIKSFLRTYGDYLGLDSRMLIDDYKRRYERPADNELQPIAPSSRERALAARGPLLPPWALIGAVLLIIVVVLYLVGRNNGKPTPTTGTHKKRLRRHRAAPRTTPTATTAPPVAQSVKIQLSATAPVYICLVDGAGNKLIPGKIFSPGQAIPTESASKLLLTLGNASVQMKLNGQTVNVAPSTSSIGYVFTPTGHHMLAGTKQPTCK
jgi:hypothetical protein